MVSPEKSPATLPAITEKEVPVPREEYEQLTKELEALRVVVAIAKLFHSKDGKPEHDDMCVMCIALVNQSPPFPSAYPERERDD